MSSATDEKEPEKKPETHRFQAEVNQVLNLVINSLYSHKEIFLRELISNASDALDKLKFRAITEPDLTKDDPTLEVRVTPDKAAGTITIEDTGVGMTHDEVVKNLGTIAHSGSRAFLEQIAQKGQKDVQLIGQFGVGFYSAYLVSDRVEVLTRAAGEEQAWRWTSEAHDTFTVEPAERATRGTTVVLHLKSDQKEFLEDWKLRELITTYSDYVSHPIKLLVTRTTGEGKDEKTEHKLETVNKASALWQRPKGEITDEQYTEFYRHLTHEGTAPLARTHFKVEGTHQFVGLLFIPRYQPYDLHQLMKRKGIRLYVRRVFIMDDCEELIPQWLRFVRGVIDSDDLPLNVSRELLQDSAVVRAIRKQVVRKTLELLEEMAKDRPDDYKAFWETYGVVMKECLTLDYEYKEKVAPLLRWESSKEGGGLVSLDEYVSRMKPEQENIFYVVGETRKAIEGSPHLEALRKRGYEVLLMTDPVDEWAVDGLFEYKGKKFVSAMKSDLDLKESDEEKK